MDLYNNVRGSCADPAGRGPSSRGSSAGTYADWSAGVTIRLSSDIRPWPAVCRPSVAGWRVAWAGVGESSRLLARWQKRKPDTIAGTRLPGYRKAYNRLWISCNAFLFVILRFLHSRRKDLISSYLS